MPLRVAVMGCVVNGPGEAREADLGVASGNGKGQIFVKGEVVKTVPESQIVETLIEEAHADRRASTPTPGVRLRPARRQRQLTRPGLPPCCARPTARVARTRPTSGPCTGCWPPTRWRPACSPAGSRPTAWTAPSLGAPLWGVGARRAAGRGLPGRGQPHPVRPSPAPRRGRGRAFADRARRAGRRCSTIVGPAASVAPAVGPARARTGARPATIRPRQPLLAIDGPPAVAARAAGPPGPARPSSTILLPAAVAMFTEEVGVSPLRVDGGAGYRARVTELVRAGQSLAWIEDGAVVFKAEIGAVSRGGLPGAGRLGRPGPPRPRASGTAGTAAVVEYARPAIAPVVSLYVNDFNAAARAAYHRVGFREVGQYASVLF